MQMRHAALRQQSGSGWARQASCPAAHAHIPRPRSHVALTVSQIIPAASPPAANSLSQHNQRVRTAAASSSHPLNGYTAEEEQEDESLARLLMVKLSLAHSTGRLDLTDMRLKTLPPDLWELRDLEDLSLAGNCLSSLPEEIGALKNLKRLGLAGNRLTSLPHSIGNLTQLEGLWLHGNLLRELPSSMSGLTSLTTLSLSGNQLTDLPDVWGGMDRLKELAAAGNRLTQVPPSLGRLRSLESLKLNGNQLASLPDSLGGLVSLQELWLQGNHLTHLPDSLCDLKSLRELYLGDNELQHLPERFAALTSLQKVWLYSNQLTALPQGMLSRMRVLTHCWLEGNVGLQGAAVNELLSDATHAAHTAAEAGAAGAATAGHGSNGRHHAVDANQHNSSSASSSWTMVHPPEPSARKPRSSSSGKAGGWRAAMEGSKKQEAAGWQLRALGLDTHQLQGADPHLIRAVGSRLKVGEVLGHGRGYFKLAPSPLTTMDITRAGTLPVDGDCRLPKQPVLVVALGSAPGAPNWGGLLGKMYKAAKTDAEKRFDVLYVVDPARQWYGASTASTDTSNGTSNGTYSSGGHHDGASTGEASLEYYYRRLEQYTQQYEHVVVLGDSMGATAALLFAPLATHVLAFCPQVDLRTSCMRPGDSDDALARLQGHVLDALQAVAQDPATGQPACKVVALSGTWQHDLDQINLLPADKVQHKVYSLESHRLALYLEGRGQLMQLVQEAVLGPLGLATKAVRTANLL